MTISQSLKKLIAKGYINRKESHKDTRAKVVTLTPKGKKLIAELIPIVEKTDAEFFNTINHSEQQSLLKLFSTLILAPTHS
jgi:DNA-binding MarR family transcriptional regulator